VEKKAKEMGFEPRVVPIENPRIEQEDHYYNPVHEILFELGYKPSTDIGGEIKKTLEVLDGYKDRINRFREAIDVRTFWKRPG
jgi:UDP-sulfoquinovose synthase